MVIWDESTRVIRYFLKEIFLFSYYSLFFLNFIHVVAQFFFNNSFPFSLFCGQIVGRKGKKGKKTGKK